MTVLTAAMTAGDQVVVERVAVAFGCFDAADSTYYGSMVNSYARGCVEHWYGDQPCGYGAYRVRNRTARHNAVQAAIVARIMELTPAAVAAGFTRGDWLADVLDAAASAADGRRAYNCSNCGVAVRTLNPDATRCEPCTKVFHYTHAERVV